MWFSALTLTFLTNSLLASATEPQVHLGYAAYEGTALLNGVSEFLGMRYAAPPTGPRRFRLPEPPLNETSIVQAKEVSCDQGLRQCLAQALLIIS
jgi:carboxylesterase type B